MAPLTRGHLSYGEGMATDTRLFGERLHRPKDTSIAGWHVNYPAAGYEDVSLCQLEIVRDDKDPMARSVMPGTICSLCKRYASNMGHPVFGKHRK